MRVIFYFIVLLSSMTSIGQQGNAIDFLTADTHIAVDAKTKGVSGGVEYSFRVIRDTTSVQVDAQHMQIENVLLDQKKIKYTYDEKKIVIPYAYKTGSTHTLKIEYKASPKKALYFVKDYQGNDQIWTQGQGKYTSNWLPSFDDMNEKVIFDLTIDFDKAYEVIANGQLVKKSMISDTVQRWHYDMTQPMSSYLVAFVIGKYQKVVEQSTNGTTLEMYYYPGDKDKFESTYKHSKRIFDYLEEEIGFSFPWQNYKQIPVKDFLYAGMENTGATIFSDAFVIDETGYVDRNYINVNAHELAHQWFGDLVTAKKGTHHWLQEGFATYYALLAEKEIFGDDYFQYKMYESAEQLLALSKTKEATALLDPKASSLTFYQRGAWALHALKLRIGATNFKITIHNYLEKYKFKNVTTTDFIAIAEEVSGENLQEYKEMWLENVKFPSQEALDILAQSAFIKKYLGLAQERTQPLAGKWGILAKALSFPVNDYLGQEVIYQLEGDASLEAIALIDKAFESNNIYVRQTIANTISKIPVGLQEQYETLLSDKSYATIEPALYHLWSNFPKKRIEYLEKTKDVIGFSDKNVRILWLVLAISTSDYKTDKHQQFYNELSSYTADRFHFTTRKNAFTYLESLQAFSDQSLLDLVKGAMHYNWRYRNFCRKILDSLLKDDKYQKKYVVLKKAMSERQQAYIEKKLTP